MMKKSKIAMLLLAAFMLVGCSESAEETVQSTEKDLATEEGDTVKETGEYVGTLGEDIALSETGQYVGKEMDATMVYWTETNHDDYPYLFHFFEKSENGSTSGTFYAKDATDGQVLQELSNYDNQDELAVKVRFVLDHEIWYDEGNDEYRIQHEISIKDAEFLELDSVESKLVSSGYYSAGNTINYQNGLSIYIAGTGTCYAENQYCAYVEVEAVNNGEEAVQMPYADFYGDDFALAPWIGDRNINGEVLAPGRKTQGVYYANLDGCDYNTIEAELYDAIVMVQFPVEESSTIYGSYHCDNGINAVIEGDVGISTDTDESYLYLAALFYDSNHYNPEFSGTLEQVSENVYHATDEISGMAELEVVFSDGGMQITVLRADSEEYEVLGGYYVMTSAIDFSQAG